MDALRSSLALIVLAVFLVAQMPNSPTGRMAGALGALAAAGDDADVDTFVKEHLAATAPSDLAASLAEVPRACAGGEITEAQKTGSHSAVISLRLSTGTCKLEYTVDAQPPHGLLTLGLNVMMGGPAAGALDLDLPTGNDAELFAALDNKLEEMAANDEFSGVILVARDGAPVFHQAYGVADRGKGRANTVDTRFDIGSITKLVTRIAAAQLAQAGKIDLEATVQEVLPAYPNPEVGSRITVQHLLDHSSGLGDIFNDRWNGADKSRLLTPESFFPLFAGDPLAFEPGSQRAYSNAGFIVLGALVAAASGESYTDYVERHIFQPAGMRHSGFPMRDGSDPGLAIGYARAESGVLGPNLGMLPIRGCPAGSSSHTAGDLLRLDQALRAGKLLDPEWTSWIYTGQRQLNEARDWPVGVAGGGPGVSALLEGDGAVTIVVLTNFDPPLGTQLGMALLPLVREVE